VSKAVKRKRRKGTSENNDAGQDDYKEARNKLRIAIERNKKVCWDQLCNQVETDPWGLPYKIVRKKLVGRRSIPGITLPGCLNSIVDTLFLKHPIEPLPVEDRLRLFPEITTDEIKNITVRISVGKAPGPDGVPDLVIKSVAKGRPEIFSKVFNQCFSEVIFPEAWKTAKLVLLPKGNKPLDQLSSYRPICLLNTAGKLFKHIIKHRLEAHLED
jgi:hypothetical protein